MLALKVVRLIETHADALAERLVQRIRSSHHITAYKDLPAEELKELAAEVYRHLGAWLMEKPEAEVERFFSFKAIRRADQGIPLSDLVWALMITKENLFRYIQANVEVQHAYELFGELEIIQAVDQFFDKAIYFVTLAYEKARGKVAIA
jgi:hypothetical protein